MALSKVRGGTTPSERLCDTCVHAHIFQGEDSREHIKCAVNCEFWVPCRVVRCSLYTDKRANTPSLRTMQDMAFILTEDNPMKTVGFISSREWKKRHKDDDILPPGVREY